MPGPCPAGQPTEALHRKCPDRERCTGAGCRYRRPKRVTRTDEQANAQAALATD